MDIVVTDFEAALRACLAGALLLWVAWCAVTLAVATVNRRLAARIGPPLLRGLLVAGRCAATAVPAQANDSGGLSALDGLRLPDRVLTHDALPASLPRSAATVVRVEPGDCLWSIVRRRLPQADETTVAEAVDRWYTANRAVIGPDPDLLHPGQLLVPPGAS